MAFLPNDNLLYPVSIKIGQSTGSGFYCHAENATYIATAKHVFFKNGVELISKEASLTSNGSDVNSKIVLNIDCEVLFAAGDLKKHPTADVAVAKIGNKQEERIALLSGVTRQAGAPSGGSILGMANANFRRFDQVEVSNEVIMFGYPASLGAEAQIYRSRPLLRRGIVAGKTEDRRIVVDCPVYFGNSGALVVEVIEEGNHRKFPAIGVATEMVPFVEELWSRQFNKKTGVRYENSGYSLIEPIDRVQELF